jgi:hypothetical protein
MDPAGDISLRDSACLNLVGVFLSEYLLLYVSMTLFATSDRGMSVKYRLFQQLPSLPLPLELAPNLASYSKYMGVVCGKGGGAARGR